MSQISREAAIDALKKISFSHWFECGEYLSEDTREIEIINSNKALEAIEALPSAQPERKKGRWIYGECDGQDGWYCSECGGFVPWDYDYYGLDNIDFIKDFKTCPRCDARMISYTGMEEGEQDG